MKNDLAQDTNSERVLQVLRDHLVVILQLALALAVCFVYELESNAFLKVMTLSVLGFCISIFLASEKRLPFFVLLSLSGVIWVLGLEDGLMLLAAGLFLIGVARIPVSLSLRITLLLLIGIMMAGWRSGLASTPWSAAFWPIFGSMFMFRMILYVRAIKANEVGPGIWNTLAYFFMLPNVAFPLFPVVDYQAFRQNYFDKQDHVIYRQGLLWISRGMMHLVIYRFIYHNVLNDALDVEKLSDLIQYLLGTFLLYLRVSGQFHIIVGILHLFGFRLPETHKLYYLAHGFTELWRRINIYWTEFMMKTVFYPTYFKTKELGMTPALIVSTATVFIATWFLHSYQWFWLRGGFPITIQDILFWAILGTLVIVGGVRELKAKKKPISHQNRWIWQNGLRAATTFLLFCFLWSLWSSESFGEWVWMFSALGNVDPKGLVYLFFIIFAIFTMGGWNWEKIQSSPNISSPFSPVYITRSVSPLIILLLIAIPPVPEVVTNLLGVELKTLTTNRLNARDAAIRHRGYYEQLDVRPKLDNMANADGRQFDNWKAPADMGIIRERKDILSRDLLPNVSVIWNGNMFSTNEFGMRDRSYSKSKPSDILRIALLGPSHVMGNGVADEETFENLVERRLNRELPLGKYQGVEILNFGVDGYAFPQQLAILKDRVFDFEPDIVIFTQYHQSVTMTETYLYKIIASGAISEDVSLSRLLESAGISNIGSDGLPVPFIWARHIVESMGIATRMPHAELRGRIRRISQEANDWAVTQIGSLFNDRDSRPIILLLNEVLEDSRQDIPNFEAITAEEIPIINALDVFDSADKASLRVAPWDDHPNAAGHELIAERLHEALLPYIFEHAVRVPDKT